MWTALDAHLASVKQREETSGVPIEQLAVASFTEVVTRSQAVDRRVPELLLHIDGTSLLDGPHEHTLRETSNGTRLPVASVRRLACEAVIVPIAFDRDGQLRMGREIRPANRAQRRALRALHRTCAHPECEVAFDHCQIHHVVFWERFGRTDIENLLPLCSRHHHLVHEGGWTLTLAPDRTITLIRPDGVVHVRGTTCDRQAWPSTAHASGPCDRSGTRSRDEPLRC